MNWLATLLFASIAIPASAQTITGTILGTVSDPSGLAIAGADVTLTQASTGAARKTHSLTNGDFIFNVLDPGIYTLSVEMAGFKTTRRTSINLTAAERRSLGTLSLEIGNVTQQVEVSASGAVVQTASAEHSGVLTSSQVDSLAIKGRNIITLLQILPGVVDTNAPDLPDRNFAIGLNINGSRRNTAGVTVDGIGLQDSGNGWISTLQVSPDAVSEVKVLLNNYQAEYGRMRGAGVEMVVKSGTRDFHGSFNYFKRHEQFNANDFFNNRNGLPKPIYRFNSYSYTIGGPVYIPNRVNRDRNKLFFFWSQELWPVTTSNPVVYVNMPTALERAGNFSQSVDTNGKLIPVKDPTTGQAFSGNIIPTTRLDPSGSAILKFFPLPNFTNQAISKGQYNYVAQAPLNKPQGLSSLKNDYNPTYSDHFYVTWSRQSDQQTSTMGLASPNSNWPNEFRTFSSWGNIVSAHYQKIFSPTLVNEFVVGYNWRYESEFIPSDQMARITGPTAGYVANQLFPNSNPENILPNVTFGGIPNTGNITLTKIPKATLYKTYNIIDNVTKTLPNHILKAGFFYNRPSTVWNPGAYDRGVLSFATDTNNPLDTGYTYANAALGVLNSYAQANKVLPQSWVYKAFEWFVQDSWKLNRRLTVEIGVRFINAPPAYSHNPQAMFDPAAYDPAKRVQFISPALVGGKRVGVDPATGVVYPVTLIGQISPGTAANYANGMVISNTGNFPQSVVSGNGITLSPRFGFAWDVFGDGKTAVRGGFGIFKSSGATGEGLPASDTTIPLVQTQTVRYAYLNTLGSAPGFLSPATVNSSQNPLGIASSYNMSLAVQRQVGFGTVVEAAYVGTLGRHLSWGFDLDPVPLGANFLAANADPSNPSTPLPANFLRRPYYGFAGVTGINWGATSNYHSLQVTANRRFARGLQFGTSWTWSKYLDSADFDTNVVSPFLPARVWNYGLAASDRRSNLRINFLYDIPSTPWKNGLSRWALNGWQVGGITGFISGQPLGIGLSTTNNADITGTASATARVVVVANPNLPSGQATFSRNFNTDAFALPAKGTLGNAATTEITGPGINNWDLSVYKNFPLKDRFRLQYRLELYNAFNHTQFAGLDTTARFDPSGNQVSTTFGQFTSSRTPRQMQMALRFLF